MISLPQLLPYQNQFLANPARFKIGLWARQTGKDFTCTCEAVLDCLRTPHTTWLIVAAGERQALESLEKAKEWAETFRRPIHEFTGPSTTARARANSAQIKWSNGSRIIALPANPHTIRGYSANLILTEFAFHEDPEAVWRAVYPSISNPLRGGEKKVRIISTPNGPANKFAQLWLNTSDRYAKYHKSRITIHEAIQHGLPLDAATLQAGLADPEAWAQEYLCEFADNSTVLFPYDLIEACESELATVTSTTSALGTSAFPGCTQAPFLYAGLDFARKNHLTVCWILEACPASTGPQPPASSGVVPSPRWVTRTVLTLQNLSTPAQLEILLPHLLRCQRICVDYTGPGVGFGDYLQKELHAAGAAFHPNAAAFRNYTHQLWRQSLAATRLELCHFTPALKAELFPRLRTALENRELLIPALRDIREDLHSVYRTVTPTGQIVYRAHSSPDGHADRATALALALRAVQTAPPPRSLNIRSAKPPADRIDPRYLPPKRILAIF